MSNITTIYLDLDGVLVDFKSSVISLIGPDWEVKEKNGTLWQEIKTIDDFWLKLKPFYNYKKLWNFTKDHKPKILTARPQTMPIAVQHKKQWCKEYLTGIDEKDILVVLRKEKQLYAKSKKISNILIDDNKENIEEWENAGGIGILHTTIDKSITELKKLGF